MLRSAVLMCLMMLCSFTAEAEGTKAALALSGRVVDQANLMDEGLEIQLTARLAELERDTGAQMVIATTTSLDGKDIADYSLQLANAWGVGSKERDDGLLLLVAPNERKVRIEVGRGLETVMTNDICAQIIQRSILPLFRQGDMSGGIVAATDEIVEVMNVRPAKRIAA